MTGSDSPSTNLATPMYILSHVPRLRVLVVAPTVLDREMLASPTLRDTHEFLWVGEEFTGPLPAWLAPRFDVYRWIDDTVASVRGKRLDGVIGPGEYPGGFLAASITERLGLPTPTQRDVVLMGHKYYSRTVQATAIPESTPTIPESTPTFEPVDPRRPRLDALSFPVFVKPVKGYMSIGAQLACHADELCTALGFDVLARLPFLSSLRPYQQLLTRHSDGRVPAHWFIAETPLVGEQVTVEVFVQEGRVTRTGHLRLGDVSRHA